MAKQHGTGLILITMGIVLIESIPLERKLRVEEELGLKDTEQIIMFKLKFLRGAMLAIPETQQQESGKRKMYAGIGFRVPTVESLRTVWLPNLKTEVSLQVKEMDKDLPTTDCFPTILLEGPLKDCCWNKEMKFQVEDHLRFSSILLLFL